MIGCARLRRMIEVCHGRGLERSEVGPQRAVIEGARSSERLLFMIWKESCNFGLYPLGFR